MRIPADYMGWTMTGIDAAATCLPITEQFFGMHTHRERARWLLSVPLDVIARDHAAISAICRDVGFRLGVAYVGVELAALMAKRRGGELSAWHSSMVQTVRAMLRQEAGYSSKMWFYRWKFW